MSGFQYGYFADREPVASVGFPNDRAKAALYKLADRLSLGVSVVDTFPMYYRIENPRAIVPSQANQRVVQGLSHLGSPLLRGYLGVKDRLAESSGVFDVRRHRTLPVELLASFAEDNVVQAAHAARTERFYRWRFANPRYENETYTARRNGTLVASIVVETEVDAGTRVTYVSDVLPMDGDETSAAAVSRLVGRIVDDYDDTDLFAAAGRTVPTEVLSAHGFHANTELPLSLVTEVDNFVARPSTDADVTEWVQNGVRLSDPDNWAFTFCEHNVG